MFAILSDLNSLPLPAQALHDRAAAPSGQFCGEASRSDAQTRSLQTTGSSQDPPDDPETEQIHSPQTPRAGPCIHIKGLCLEGKKISQQILYFLQPQNTHQLSIALLFPDTQSFSYNY